MTSSVIPHEVTTEAGDLIETDDFETAKYAAEILVRDDGHDEADVHRVAHSGARLWQGTATRRGRDVTFVSFGAKR